MTRGASRHWGESFRGCRRIRGLVGCCWLGLSMVCCGKPRFRRRCFRSAIRFAAEQGRHGPRDHGTVRSRSDVVDRVAALQAFYAGVPIQDPHLDLHPGGARNVLRTAEQLYHLVDVPLAARAEQVDAALMQTLLDAFPDRLAKLRAGTQDRALMVGGRGVRLEFDSRVRGEALLLAIDINDAGGEARARMASAVEREWLRSDMLRMSDELFFNPTRRQVEARRERIGSICCWMRRRRRLKTWRLRPRSWRITLVNIWTSCCRRAIQRLESIWLGCAGWRKRGPTWNCRRSTMLRSSKRCPRFVAG